MTADMRQRGHFHVFFGLALIVWGLLAILDNFGFIAGRELFRLYWPGLFLFWGAGLLLFGHPGQRVFGAFLGVFGALFFADRFYGWHVNFWLLIWPVMLIVFGLRVIFGSHDPWRASRRAQRAAWHANRAAWRASVAASRAAGGSTPPPPADASGPHVNDDTDTSATFREFAFLGGVERRNTSQTFRGGSATAFMGGVDIDLRDCRMADGGAQIDVFAMMGGISLKIPRDWTVQSEVTAILGGFQDYSSPPVGSEVKRLVITGQVVMGGIEIKN